MTKWILGLAILALSTASCGEDAPASSPSVQDVTLPAGTDAGVDAEDSADAPATADVTLDLTVGPDVAIPAPIPCKSTADCPVSVQPCTQAACLVGGTCAVVQWAEGQPCDDGDPCTLGETCGSTGQCQSSKSACGCVDDSECADLDDGNLCNGKPVCNTTVSPTRCEPDPSAVVTCKPGWQTPCQIESCDPKTGTCQAEPSGDGTPCDDGDLCTEGDVCQAGKCTAGKGICACKANADCPDDGDLCNGVPYCDKGGSVWTCKTNPGSVVACSPAGDTACLHNTCDPKTGKCSLTPFGDGGACNDGDPCTGGDSCKAGVCLAGANLCGCQSDGDCAGLDDGNPCNGKLFCNKTVAPHICQVNPATVVTCPTVSDSECAKAACNPTTGQCEMKAQGDGKACSDGNPCTMDEACSQGTCKASVNTCPCQANADCVGKDDGNLCNGTLFCDKSQLPYQCKVNPATVVTCPTVDDTACQVSACQPKIGTCAPVPLPDGATCDADGSFCTVGDTCQGGACLAGPNTCPCQTDADCAKAEDGNACNGTLFCDKQQKICQVNPVTVITCPTGQDTACLQNVCDKTNGMCQMTPVHQGQACDADGSPCTQADFCQDGQCQPGTNVCACQGDGDCGAFDDANLCNGKLYCDKTKAPFVCKPNPATVIVCPVGSLGPCLVNTCDPASGKCDGKPIPDDSPCEDGKLCTFGDVCLGGSCLPGKPVCQCYDDTGCAGMEDGNLCNGTLFCDKSKLPFTCKLDPATVVVCATQADTACVKAACAPGTGQCAPVSLPDGTTCTDGSACTQPDKCASGQCKGTTVTCNDGNACTVDGCDPLTGCTALDSAAAACNDEDPCTADSCAPSTGCKWSPLDQGPCDDGDACTSGEQCKGGKCGGGLSSCDDGNPCTDDTCGAGGKSCSHLPNSGPCDEGRQCVGGTCGGCASFRRVLRWEPDPKTPDTKNLNREELESATVLPGGRLAAVGAVTIDGTNQTRGWLVVTEPSGRLVSSTSHGAGQGERLLGVSPRPGGGVAAVGTRPNAQGIGRPWLLVVGTDGKELASVLLPGQAPEPKGQFSDVAVLADGTLVAVGSVDTASDAADAVLARYSAQGSLIWQKVLGSQPTDKKGLIDRLNAVLALPDGTFLAAGERGRPGLPEQQQDGWLVRLDAAGEILWQRDVGGKAMEGWQDLARAPDGTLVAVGTTRAAPAVAGDGWVVKLDAKGQALTEVKLDGGGDDALRAVGWGPEGDWRLAGTVVIDPIAGSAPAFDRGHAWALRVGPALEPGWERRYDGLLGLEKFRGGVVLPDGDLVAAGTSASTSAVIKPDALLLRLGKDGGDGCGCEPFTEILDVVGSFEDVTRTDGGAAVTAGFLGEATGPAKGWLQALGADGKALWSQQISAGGTDRLHGVVRVPGGVLAVGETAGTGGQGREGWVVRASATGQILGQSAIGGPDDDHLQRVAAAGKTVVAVGWTTTASSGYEDGWIARLQTDGVPVWTKVVGTPGLERLHDVAVLGSGRLVAVGSTKASSNAFVLRDTWLVVLEADGTVVSTATGVSVPEQYWTSATTLADGGALITGYGGPGGLVLQRFDAMGNVLSKSALALPGHNRVLGDVLLGDGTVAVVGYSGAKFGDAYARGLGGRLNPDGTQVWSDVWITMGTPYQPHRFDGLTLQADGTLLGVGSGVFDGKLRPVLRRFQQNGDTDVTASCLDPSACEAQTCDVEQGCVQVVQPWACDDDNPCTSQDTCSTGKCQQWSETNCDDGNPCTAEACGNPFGCYPIPLEDGLACSATAVCGGGACGTCSSAILGFGNNTRHLPLDVTALADGGALVAGATNLLGTSAPKNGLEGWVSRIDGQGKTIWSWHVLTAGDERLEALGVRPSGDIVAVGWREAYPAAANGREAWWVHLDPSGKLLGEKVMGGVWLQEFLGARATAAGTVLCGQNAGKQWVMELDAKGEILWQVTLPAKLAEVCLDVVPYADGHVLSGMTGSQAVVTRLDKDHAVLWQHVVPPIYHKDRLYRLLVGPDGTLTGIGTRDASSGDLWILRLDGTGKKLWEYLPNQVNYQMASDGVLLPDGGVLAVGRGTHQDGQLGYVVRVDASGKAVWAKGIGDNLDLEGVALGPGGVPLAVGPVDNAAKMVRIPLDGKLLCGP